MNSEGQRTIRLGSEPDITQSWFRILFRDPDDSFEFYSPLSFDEWIHIMHTNGGFSIHSDGGPLVDSRSNKRFIRYGDKTLVLPTPIFIPAWRIVEFAEIAKPRYAMARFDPVTGEVL